MKYFFYSRKNGFSGGKLVKVYFVGGWEGLEKFVGMNGGEIMLLNESPEWLKKEGNIYKGWHLYPEDQVITDIRTVE